MICDFPVAGQQPAAPQSFSGQDLYDRMYLTLLQAAPQLPPPLARSILYLFSTAIAGPADNIPRPGENEMEEARKFFTQLAAKEFFNGPLPLPEFNTRQA
ncbi:MAG: hypothetical protein GC129_05225 [Proteobacteria bacterium]|nr:hypothetical protein [Pseudomonadota bacterium]